MLVGPGRLPATLVFDVKLPDEGRKAGHCLIIPIQSLQRGTQIAELAMLQMKVGFGPPASERSAPEILGGILARGYHLEDPVVLVVIKRDKVPQSIR